MASPRKQGTPACPKCRLPLVQTAVPSLSFTCTNCGVSYIGKKQASTPSPLPSVHKAEGKQITRSKHKDENSDENLLRLPSIKPASPGRVSCTIAN